MIINSPEEWKAWLLWAGNPKTTALSLRWLSEAAHKMKHLCYFASLASKCQWLFHGVLLLLLLTKITYVSGERSHELLINRYYISRNCRSTMNLYPSKGKNSPNLSDASQILLSQPLLVVGFELQVVGGHFDLCYEPLSPWDNWPLFVWPLPPCAAFRTRSFPVSPRFRLSLEQMAFRTP